MVNIVKLRALRADGIGARLWQWMAQRHLPQVPSPVEAVEAVRAVRRPLKSMRKPA